MDTQTTNRLADATSPYLQQHAHNPVDWWPWCQEALQAARDQDKPILLSIGYSACHWCHVMAHESFEDPETATVMNELFINIKVDREERPDLDKIYQAAHQLLAQRAGGWPLTVFLTPHEQMPFFAGTYFPPEQRHGLPAFRHLLRQIAKAYREQTEAIGEQNRSLQQALERLEPAAGDPRQTLSAAPLHSAREQLGQHFDTRHGGFGSAPKFPHPSNLDFLLRRGSDEQDEDAIHMALFSLECMDRGGMNDLLGGGFCRYSVDDRWMIPHFEKMLYDNGPLLSLNADAWALTGEALFRETCERTASWVMREMQSPEGGYYASLDADSEGEEGRFYVWDREQAKDLLSAEEFQLFAAVYGLDRSANFEGRWHLHGYRTIIDVAQQQKLDPARAEGLLTRARAKLFAARELRVRPGRDDKILASWNALMIKGMARAGRLLDRPAWIDSAQQSLDFLQRAMWRDGRLLASYKDGHANLAAYLDDHAYLIEAVLELLQARWRSRDLEFAIDLAEILLAHFEDKTQGGFYFTADDHEQLIYRPKPFSDDAMPAGNGVAAFALQRLGHLLGNTDYTEAAERTLRAAWPHLSSMAYAHPTLLSALQEYLQPPETLVIRGEPEALDDWRLALNKGYAPHRSVYLIESKISDLPGILRERRAQDGTTAYLCQGTHCLPPQRDLVALAKRLHPAAGAETNENLE